MKYIGLKYMGLSIVFLSLLGMAIVGIDKVGTDQLLMDEYTLYPESKIDFKKEKISSPHYYFNGFINRDTLSFGRETGRNKVDVFLPAIVNHTFKLNQIEDVEFTITEINLEQNYITLKTRKTEY